VTTTCAKFRVIWERTVKITVIKSCHSNVPHFAASRKMDFLRQNSTLPPIQNLEPSSFADLLVETVAHVAGQHVAGQHAAGGHFSDLRDGRWLRGENDTWPAYASSSKEFGKNCFSISGFMTFVLVIFAQP
jgi:hypothetical protein